MGMGRQSSKGAAFLRYLVTPALPRNRETTRIIRFGYNQFKGWCKVGSKLQVTR
jgi:hypothetical protein